MSAVIAQVLREWGDCFRGDWGDIDGRSLKIEMDDIADALEGNDRAAWSIEKWRQDLGMCPTGGGHWTRHCCPLKRYGDGPEDFYGCGNEPTKW